MCGFLIIKQQTALHHAVWCGAVHHYLQCGTIMPFCGRFWCCFCGLCGLVNTPSHEYQNLTLFKLNEIESRNKVSIILRYWKENIFGPGAQLSSRKKISSTMENPPRMDIAEGKRGNRPMAKLQTVPQGRESTKVEKDYR